MNVVKIFLFFLHLFFLGFCFHYPWKQTVIKKNISLHYCNYFLSGIILNHFLLLLFFDIPVGLTLSFLFSLLGLIFFIKKRSSFFIFQGHHLFLLLLLFFSLIITFHPLPLGDGHTNWFFPGKIFYYFQKITLSELENPYYSFSHPGYPKLVAIIAAQLATLGGFWNNYLPNFSLVILLIPFLLWVFAYFQNKFIFLFLLLSLFFSQINFLINGYMDYYLCLALCVAFILLCFFEGSSQEFLGFTFLVFALLLKQEAKFGILAVLIPYALKNRFHLNKKALFFFSLQLLPFIAWEIIIRNFQLKKWDPIQFTFSQFFERLFDPLWNKKIYTSLLYQTPLVKNWAYAFIIFLFLKKYRPNKNNYLFALFFFLYFFPLCFIYYITQSDLDWLLKVSMDRVSMPLFTLPFFFILYNTQNFGQNKKGESIFEK